MRPVQQTKFGSPDGNCFSACVATIFELPLDHVPDFKGDRWRENLTDWLFSNYSLVPQFIQTKLGGGLIVQTEIPHLIYSIACGPGPRGPRHSVVRLGPSMAWDPHPDATGLKEMDEYILFVTPNPLALKR